MAVEDLLGSNSATADQPLMDDIAALVTLTMAAERVGSAAGSIPDVIAAYYVHVHRFARDRTPLRDAADALSLIVGLEELRRLGLIEYTDELGLCLDEHVRLRYTGKGRGVWESASPPSGRACLGSKVRGPSCPSARPTSTSVRRSPQTVQ
jgi:hypothetical protein